MNRGDATQENPNVLMQEIIDTLNLSTVSILNANKLKRGVTHYRRGCSQGYSRSHKLQKFSTNN
tara:strand:- start:761 stop:952 length:192 start_codon:yes stop_codon:yes gene_type:complete